MNAKLTIFTPTYNRAYILPSCYESLRRQTCMDFEWVIVDDGSTDDTRSLVEEWITEGCIKIKYIYQENGGKHRAHNKGINSSEGELFLCLDSDDILVERAVEIVIEKSRYIGENVGMIALKGFKSGPVVGTSMPKNVKNTSMFDLYHKYGFRGDSLPIFKTEILKTYLYPEIEGEKFITEAVIYNRISALHELILVDEIIYKCDYLPDGYTRNIRKIIQGNPQGYILYYKEIMLMSCGIKEQIKSIINYIALSLHAKNNKIIEQSPRKIITAALFPLGYIYYYARYSSKFR
ncbi:glycosyltransferase family 2 protein [Bacillus cereus]|uniref:glycosyltransferase family 2 protein n=1 Tax=Bacillus cereus TaxID=1396 RepID=UPI0037F474EA